MVDMKHVALLSVNRFKVSRKKKIDKLFKDPAMTFHPRGGTRSIHDGGVRRIFLG